MLIRILIIVMAAILAGPHVGSAQPAKPSAVTEATLATAPSLPSDWRVRSLDGALHPLSEWRGRVVVLNLWASWCPPCLKEMDSFRALRDSLDADGLSSDAVDLMLVSPESVRRVSRFVAKRLPDMPVFVEHDPLPPQLGVRAVPTTWILDREGRVAFAHRGAADWSAPEVRELLRVLAADNSTAVSGGAP